MRNLFVALAAVLAASVIWNTSQAGDILSSTEVGQLLSGNTLTGTTKKGDKFWVLYREDGTAGMIMSSGFKDKGKWRVESDGRICNTWKKLNKGKQICNDRFEVRGTEVTFSRVGSKDKIKNKIEQGNPGKL